MPFLTRMINARYRLTSSASAARSGLEKYPNDGHFVQKTYTNEVYSVRGKRQERLVLRNAPVAYLIVTGNLTHRLRVS